MSKLKLPNVCLVLCDCKNYGAAVASLKRSMEQVDFAAVKFFTDINIKVEGVETVIIKPIKSTEDYSWWIIKEMYQYINTDYVLVTQHDSWVIDADAWTDEFLKYDYIGSPWLYVDGRNVGNGGFSLRSRALMTIVATDEIISVTHHEDDALCRLYRPYLEQEREITFAPEELADKFAFELRAPIQPTFGFHSYFHKPYQKTVLIKRTAALGDVVAVEPVLRHFHEQGWRVILETLPQFELLFQSHYFPVLFPKDLDPRIIPDKTYNLDMSYESNPKQLHLKSYYDFCEVTDGDIRNPQLDLGFVMDANSKLIKKYIVLHIDVREQPHRNIYNVEWHLVVQYLNNKGYTVFQIGKGEHETVNGAIEMKIINEQFLMYVVAGADMMVGIDSGIAAIAVALNVPSVIMSGSVNLEYIHPNTSRIEMINNHHKKVCDTPFCWHDVVGCEGKDCSVSKLYPPCAEFTSEQIINGIETLLNKVK